MTEPGVKLRIECPSVVGYRARLWIDDEEVTGKVCRVEVAWDVSKINHATITYLVRELEVDSAVCDLTSGHDANGDGEM